MGQLRSAIAPTAYHPTGCRVLPTACRLLPTTYRSRAHVVGGAAAYGGHAQRVSEGSALRVVVDQAKALDRLLVPRRLNDPIDHRALG